MDQAGSKDDSDDEEAQAYIMSLMEKVAAKSAKQGPQTTYSKAGLNAILAKAKNGKAIGK